MNFVIANIVAMILGIITNDNIINDVLSKSLVAYSVVDVNSGKVINEQNSNTLMLPASVMKVVTTASALEIIPAQKQFETTIGYSGEIKNNILYGSLIVTGCGDPTLGSKYINSSKEAVFENIYSSLNKSGIKGVCGDIVCNEDIFPFNGARGYWLAEDMGNYFAAESYGFNFIDNYYTLHINTGANGSRATVAKCEPEMPDINFINRLAVEGDQKDSAYINGTDFDRTRILSGRVPRNKNGYTIKGSIPSPSDVFKRELKKFLRQKGAWIEQSKPADYHNTQGRLGAIYSPALCKIATVTNHRSNNLYAETLLKWCAVYKGMQATTSNGIKAVKDIWSDNGVDMSGCIMFDGSGLSLKNRITPSTISAILCKAYGNEHFYLSLPQVGKEGTVKNFMKESALAPSLRLKSGSMQGVQCYAGYYNNGSKCLAIVVMVNNFEVPNRVIQKEIGKLIERIIEN